MKLLLFKGRGIISRLIRWQTRSKYSHAAILVDEESSTIIESWQGAGVRSKKITDWRDIEVFNVDLQGEHKEAAVLMFLIDQVGKHYDYSGVIRFVSRRKPPRADNQKWFCSELVFAAFQYAGVNLLERIDAAAVSPGLLALSPKLTVRYQ